MTVQQEGRQEGRQGHLLDARHGRADGHSADCDDVDRQGDRHAAAARRQGAEVAAEIEAVHWQGARAHSDRAPERKEAL